MIYALIKRDVRRRLAEKGERPAEPEEFSQGMSEEKRE